MSENSKAFWRNIRRVLAHAATAALSALATLLAGGQIN